MFSAVADLLGKRCGTSGCHDASKQHTNLTSGDLAALHKTLMGPPTAGGSKCTDQTLVVPNMPEKSLLLAMVGADNGPRNGCASRMPFTCMPGGSGDKGCLTDTEITRIRDWISAGAPQ
jgi:hypothetical protein